MKEVVKLIEKVVSEKRIDRHQGLNAVLDFLIDVFDARHYTTEGVCKMCRSELGKLRYLK